MTKRADILWPTVRIAGMAIAILLALIVLTGVFWGSRHFVVNRHVVFYDDLPEQFDGYRILHFSDLHTGTFRGGREGDISKIVNLINEQQCDLVAFTGDIVNRKSNELGGIENVLKRVKAPDGVYCVLGNHDYGTYSDMTEEQQKKDVEYLLLYEQFFGWKPLMNENVRIQKGKQSIVIAGIENYGRPPFPQKGNVVQALKGAKKSDFIVMLSHDPNAWKMLIQPSTSTQLTLSGHTHAGQFQIWGWSPVSMKYDEWSGIYKEGTQVLNVSGGVGGLIGPFRFGAWPEISVITLRRLPRVKK